MDKQDEKQTQKKDFLFIFVFVFLILLVIFFNFLTDPYYILRDATIKGFNNVKTHKYSNKRTIIYSDIKLNSKKKDTAFTGNCVLSHYGSGLDNVAFFTIPVTKVEEIAKIIMFIRKKAPNIKKIYWGMHYDDFWNAKNDVVNDNLPENSNSYFTFQDFINLFFSYNTTKYSIETVRDSLKNKGNNTIYVYPYREIAKKKYNGDFSYEELDKIKEVKDFADKNGIELIIYYSPIHISKKIDLYEKEMWQSNQELKRQLVKIMPFYDYSFQNEYNSTPIDENNFNFIDNIHPSNTYNNLIVNDLLSKNKKIGTLVTKGNVELYLKKDTEELQNYMIKNKNLVENIKNAKFDDANISIIRKDSV